MPASGAQRKKIPILPAMLSLGPFEIVVILAVALIFVGPDRLPEVARQVGKVVGQIRRTTDELRRTLDQEIREDERDQRLAEYKERQKKAQAERERALVGTGEGATDLVGAPAEAALDAEAAASPPEDIVDLGPAAVIPPAAGEDP